MRAALFRAYAAMRARPLLDYLAAIEASQWLPPERVLSLQTEKLRAILKHAARTVPFYQERFREARFDPEGVRGPADLGALPPLERDTVAERLEEMAARPAAASMTLRSTGGSTGRPTRFLVDDAEMRARSAHIYRNLRWLGWDLGERAAYLWGSDVDSKEHKGWKGAARDAFAGVLWMDAFRIGREDLDSCLARLSRFDPAVLIGYPSSLHLLAERARETAQGPKLRGIETSAEMLAPRVRRDLEETFGCRVLDRYGCREAGVVAHECAEGRMHVNAEAVVMESVGGEVLLTTLNNRAMPLIRYRNEDLATLSQEQCPCGRGLPLVERVRGRVSDIIRSPSGRLIHGEFFTHLFYEAPGVRRFQVRQTSADRLEVSVVGTEAFDDRARLEMEKVILAHADPAFRITWISVPEIAVAPSGKFRFTVSELPPAATNR
jgi:phenylacetate-coenzyme A ligase PaaK-like adenylate-forming protein